MSANMSPPRILISGASVAGPALAYWLGRAGCTVTVVERAPSLRTEGQGIDVRDSARDVAKRMGIFDELLARSSHEEGVEVVDRSNRCFASFPVDKSGKGDGPTCDIEILRGELAKILYEHTKDNTSYIFGDTVDSLEETDKHINAHFSSGSPARPFDLVVAADGIGSKIRRMTFEGPEHHVKSQNAYVSYFSIPRGDTDTMWARVHWYKGGRVVTLRPDNVGRMRVFLSLIAYDKSDERLARLAKAAKQGVSAQKALMQELFQDVDWETPRILKGMHDADDWYFQHIAQVKLDRWSSGRVAVIGDAGFAPSPFAGAGTSIAFIAAYVLAGEISRQPNDIPAALASYERRLRPYVASVQKLAPGVPWAVCPQSKLGVKAVETCLWAVSAFQSTLVATMFSKIWALLPFGEEETFELPEYEAFKE